LDVRGLENDAERLNPLFFAVRAETLGEADVEVAVEIGKGLISAG
jgi:hypothetical protein